MKTFLYIVLCGWVVLLGTIILNVCASFFDLATWHDVIYGEYQMTPYSFIWLMIIYPCGLGFIVYGIHKVYVK